MPQYIMDLTLEEARQKAVEAHQAGQTRETERLYSFVLTAQPNHPGANHNMGVLAVSVGREAKSHYHFFKQPWRQSSRVTMF